MDWKWKLAQKLEFIWWKRYLQDKDPDTYLDRKKRYWQDLLARMSPWLPLPGNQQILDAGCGPAGIFLVLEGNQVDAIDSLLGKYEQLSHFQPQNVPWTRFRTLSMEDLDETEKYDVIFCMNAINHVRNLPLCYDKLVKALKPEGYLVVSTDAHRNRFLKKLFQLLPGDMLHPVQLDIREYENFLTERKMHILKSFLSKREPIFDYYVTVSQKKAS